MGECEEVSRMAGVYGFVVWVDNKAFVFLEPEGLFSHG